MSDDTSTQESTVSDDPATAPDRHVTSHAAVARRGGDWEQVGRRAVARLLSDALEDLQQETDRAVDAVRRGETVTVDHVHVLREVLDAYEHAVENHLAALADEAEPWSIDGPAWSDGERPRFSRGSTGGRHDWRECRRLRERCAVRPTGEPRVERAANAVSRERAKPVSEGEPRNRER